MGFFKLKNIFFKIYIFFLHGTRLFKRRVPLNNCLEFFLNYIYIYIFSWNSSLQQTSLLFFTHSLSSLLFPLFFHGTRLFKRRVCFFFTHPLSSLLSPFSYLLSLTLSPLSSLLSPMWQKLPYICNNFFHYSNLSITFLNCCTIEKSPVM